MFDLIGLIFFAWAIADVIQGTNGYDWHTLLGCAFLIVSYTVKTHTEAKRIREHLEHSSGYYIEERNAKDKSE